MRRFVLAVVITFAVLAVHPDIAWSQEKELPPAVKEVLKQLRDEAAAIQRKADAEIRKKKLVVIRELQILQDRYCKEGKLDAALEVRKLIRATITPTSVALPDPRYVNSPAADIGKVIHYRTTGRTNGSIYGTALYTTGSDLGTAAVHSGVLKVGETGVVRVKILPGMAHYPSTVSNGVKSIEYGNWGVSFSVEKMHPVKLFNDKGKLVVRRDPKTLHAFRGQNGRSFFFKVVGAKRGAVRGTGVYTDDSTLAAAAVHSGVLQYGKTGIVKVTILPGRSTYKGTTQHGVTSKSWEGWVGSYRVEAAGTNVLTEAAQQSKVVEEKKRE